MGQITSVDFIRLLKKYGLVIIAFELVTRFGLPYIISFYHQTFPIQDLSTLNDLNSLITAVTYLSCDLVIGLIILNDLDRSKNLTWVIFGLTFLNPWTSVFFTLIWKAVDLKANDGQRNYS